MAIKPQEINKVMITDLVDQFCAYYKNHLTKQVVYFRDKYGDNRQPNVKNALSYNNQAIAQVQIKRMGSHSQVSCGNGTTAT